MKKRLSLNTSKILQYIVFGSLWILASIFEFIGTKICLTLSLIFTTLAIVASSVYLFSKKEPEDEMSEKNLKAAKASTLDIVISVVLFSCCYRLLSNLYPTLIPDINIKLSAYSSVTLPLGLIYLAIGLFYIFYEKTGE